MIPASGRHALLVPWIGFVVLLERALGFVFELLTLQPQGPAAPVLRPAPLLERGQTGLNAQRREHAKQLVAEALVHRAAAEPEAVPLAARVIRPFAEVPRRGPTPPPVAHVESPTAPSAAEDSCQQPPASSNRRHRIVSASPVGIAPNHL